jgi:hypothetical protein
VQRSPRTCQRLSASTMVSRVRHSTFTGHALPLDWTAFLGDFYGQWPTPDDDVDVEVRARAARSSFRFDVHGAVAKSTHARLAIVALSSTLGEAHPFRFWPFDGWGGQDGYSAVVEVYPALRRRSFPREDRNRDQHDANCVAALRRGLQLTDCADTLGKI